MALAVLLLALGLELTREANAFDCRRASSPTELAICEDPELRAYDARLVEVYRKLLPRRGASLQLDQLRWLKYRDAHCRSNRECLEEIYSIRLVRLDGTGPMVKVAGRWRVKRELFPLIRFEGVTFWGADSHILRYRPILLSPDRTDFGGAVCFEPRIRKIGSFAATRLTSIESGGFGFMSRDFPGVRVDDPVSVLRFECFDSQPRNYKYEGTLLWIERLDRFYLFTAGTMQELGRDGD